MKNWFFRFSPSRLSLHFHYFYFPLHLLMYRNYFTAIMHEATIHYRAQDRSKNERQCLDDIRHSVAVTDDASERDESA